MPHQYQEQHTTTRRHAFHPVQHAARHTQRRRTWAAVAGSGASRTWTKGSWIAPTRAASARQAAATTDGELAWEWRVWQTAGTAPRLRKRTRARGERARKEMAVLAACWQARASGCSRRHCTRTPDTQQEEDKEEEEEEEKSQRREQKGKIARRECSDLEDGRDGADGAERVAVGGVHAERG
eukprot:1773094-Rhodomonas_salina.1